jgi:hypothetical protein
VDTVVKLKVRWNFEKFFSSCTTGGLLRRSQLHGLNYLAQFILSVTVKSEAYSFLGCGAVLSGRF